VLAAHSLQVPVQIPVISRCFHTTPIALAKGKKGKGKKHEAEEVAEEVIDDTPLIDMEDATTKFKSVVEKFTKQANEVKMGKANPRIFDKFTVTTHDGEVPFTSVAQTTVKGRNFIITLFDPANSKHVINTVLGSNLNLNAQVDPTNKFTLKVPLPPINTETKKESVKQLKETFEKFKHSPQKNQSLSAIRTDVKHKFQTKLKKKKPTDSEQKVLNDFEKLHKQYTDKLSEIFKAAETAIMK
jgi:ribosome recycling factor